MNVSTRRTLACAVLSLLAVKCGGPAPAGGSGTACGARAPYAVWLVSSTLSAALIPARRPLVLDGTQSVSYVNGSLSFRWTLVSRPQGSVAQLPASGANPTFTPDLAGDYTISLVVSDACGASAPSQQTISASEFPPIAHAGAAYVAYAVPAGTVSADGSASSDLNGDALTFSWAMAAPAGSAATLVNPGQAITRFTPDVEGNYSLTLTVSDGTGRSDQATKTIGIYHPAAAVGAYAVDADYSGFLDRVILVTNEPALRIANPHDGTSTSIALDALPTAVRVSPDGKSAAVSQYKHFSVVDLVLSKVTATYAPTDPTWTYDGGDVVLDGRGDAYAFPRLAVAVEPFIVTLSSGASKLSSAGGQSESSIFLKPAYDAAVANLYVSYAGILRDAAGAGTLSYSARSVVGPNPGAGPFLSSDGTQLFTGDGEIWSASSLTSTGSLLASGDMSSFIWMAHSGPAGKLVAVQGTSPYGADAFRVYGGPSLALLEKHFNPGIVANQVADTGQLQWAFWKPDGSGYYIVFVSGSGTGIAAY